MLGWSELAEVASEGVEIGAHSATHPQMDLLAPSALRRETTTPRTELEDRLSVAVQSFA
jgi:peptidoglycan/xylan/chitin deacetylase (PgdA/CDA1 family)